MSTRSAYQIMYMLKSSIGKGVVKYGLSRPDISRSEFNFNWDSLYTTNCIGICMHPQATNECIYMLYVDNSNTLTHSFKDNLPSC